MTKYIGRVAFKATLAELLKAAMSEATIPVSVFPPQGHPFDTQFKVLSVRDGEGPLRITFNVGTELSTRLRPGDYGFEFQPNHDGYASAAPEQLFMTA